MKSRKSKESSDRKSLAEPLPEDRLESNDRPEAPQKPKGHGGLSYTINGHRCFCWSRYVVGCMDKIKKISGQSSSVKKIVHAT